MTSFRIMIAVLSAVILAWFVIPHGDPHEVKLPMGSGDPAPIAKDLDRLSDEERDLATGYMKRSRGDVLTPALADPDEPFTARTIGGAIELQKKWLVKVAEMKAVAEAHKAERDKAYAPLREALSAELLKRELTTKSALYSPRADEEDAPPDAAPKAALPDDPEILVATYELKNTTERTITHFEAAATVRKTRPEANELGILSDCWMTETKTLASNDTTTVRCANVHRPAGADERAFAAMSEEAFYVDWEPRLIRFEDGDELKFADPLRGPAAAAE